MHRCGAKREPPLLALKAQQVPARAEQIVRKALRKDKEERYQSVEEMLSDLRRLREVSESTVKRLEAAEQNSCIPCSERRGGTCRSRPVHLPAPDANGNEHFGRERIRPGLCDFGKKHCGASI